MITKKEFYDYITSYQLFENAIDRIETAISGKSYGFGLWESDWYDAVGRMLNIFLDSHFTETGTDLITWWLWEDVDKVIYETVDPDLFSGKTEVERNVEDFDDLWKYMIKHEKDYFKNV